jgi:predicted DNA-binding transcriptional regulator AlpA
MTTSDRLLSSREAAEIIGLRESTLAAWRSRRTKGQPPAVRVGKRSIRYSEAALCEWIATRQQTPKCKSK